MVPKSSKELIKPTAEKLDVNQELVQDIVSFYWAEVRKSLVDMKGHNIALKGLGTFKIKDWKLPEVKEKYETMITRYKEKQETQQVTFQRFSIMKDLEAQVDKIKNVERLIEQDKEKKNKVKQKRNGNLDTQKTDI